MGIQWPSWLAFGVVFIALSLLLIVFVAWIYYHVGRWPSSRRLYPEEPSPPGGMSQD